MTRLLQESVAADGLAAEHATGHPEESHEARVQA